MYSYISSKHLAKSKGFIPISLYNNGFTLVELLVVFGVIGILVVGLIIALNVPHQFDKAKDAQRRNDFEQFRNAEELYYNDHNYYSSIIPFGSPFTENSAVYMAKTSQDPDCNGSTQNCTPYLYIADPNNPTHPQWYVAYGRLAMPPQDPTLTCLLPCIPPAPPGYNLCVYGGNVNCNTLTGVFPSTTPISTPTNTPVPSPTPTPAAVALDATSTPPQSMPPSNSTITWQHPTGNYPNRLLVVEIGSHYAGSISVTYGGQSLQLYQSVDYTQDIFSPPYYSLQFWYLVNPSVSPPGGTTIAVQNNSGFVFASAATFYNVNQNQPFGAYGTYTLPMFSSGSTSSVTLNNTTSNQMVIAGYAVNYNCDDASCRFGTTATFSASNGQTTFWSNNGTQIGQHHIGGGCTSNCVIEYYAGNAGTYVTASDTTTTVSGTWTNPNINALLELAAAINPNN